MRWTDLLFAHWPVPASQITPLIPQGFAVDTYDGTAWVGVIPFRMERVQLHGLPPVPSANIFAEANVRTYVRDRKSGQPGVFFFSLDANNPLAVIAARSWYRLPYYFARMRVDNENYAGRPGLQYCSRRIFAARPAVLEVRYCGAGLERASPSQPDTLEHFLTERYALFTHSNRRLIRADIHHLPWNLEPAEAEFEQSSIAAAQSIHLPPQKPILHYSRLLDVFAWPPRTIV